MASGRLQSVDQHEVGLNRYGLRGTGVAAGLSVEEISIWLAMLAVSRFSVDLQPMVLFAALANAIPRTQDVKAEAARFMGAAQIYPRFLHLQVALIGFLLYHQRTASG
jgi:hypothetical protein